MPKTILLLFASRPKELSSVHAKICKRHCRKDSTPDNYLFKIKAHAKGPTVDVLWFAVIGKHGTRSTFVYDLDIKEEVRRQGHAQKAFEALETLALSMELGSIGLHVFSHNLEAQALYTKLGYKITGINMAKTLSADQS